MSSWLVDAAFTGPHSPTGGDLSGMSNNVSYSPAGPVMHFYVDAADARAALDVAAGQVLSRWPRASFELNSSGERRRYGAGA